jgi:hypothetical protein
VAWLFLGRARGATDVFVREPRDASKRRLIPRCSKHVVFTLEQVVLDVMLFMPRPSVHSKCFRADLDDLVALLLGNAMFLQIVCLVLMEMMLEHQRLFKNQELESKEKILP